MSASPQLENGYTRIANELLDALLRAGLTSRQWAVAMAIVRKTYGFNKKEDDIGLSQLTEMTGIAKSHVSVAVRELEARAIITRKQGEYGHFLGLNKRHKTWLTVTETVTPITESVTVTESVKEGYRIGNERVTETVQTPVTESVTTKDNHTKDKPKRQPPKDMLTQTQRERFERFWAAYPKRKSKGRAEQAFAKLKPDEQLLADILAGIERAMKSAEWHDSQYIPHPSSWLNAKGWLDDVRIAYSSAERAVIEAFNESLGDQLGRIDPEVMVESRAAAIRVFLGLSDKPDFWKRFFPWVRENCDLPPRVGFDWLITPAAFTKVKGGQHTKRETA